MENKFIQKLTIVLGAIVFSFVLANSASADYATQYSYYQSGYDTNYYNNSVIPPANPPYAFYPSGYSNVNRNYYNSYNNNQVVQQAVPQYAYYQQSGYSNTAPVATTASTPNVVNNYYYQATPATAKKATTTTTTTNTTTNTNSANPTYIPATNTSSGANTGNGLGASAYNYGNGITALSLRGSGSFMPSSIWQWIIVFFLICAIIVIARMFVHKPVPGEHTPHAH